MYNPPMYQSNNHLRFYIVLITVVVGGIFFLLLLNNSSSGEEGGLFSGITGALISDDEKVNSTTKKSSEDGGSVKGYSEKSEEIEKLFVKEVENSKNEIPVVLVTDEIPEVLSRTQISMMELDFDDLTTNIQVNDDNLELNGLSEVSLRLKGFKGTIDFDLNGFSLEGTAKRIEVNDISLSSKDELKISFDGLRYRRFSLEDVELKEVTFDGSSGSLRLRDKLDYTLDNEEVKLYQYIGSFTVDGSQDVSQVTSLIGTAKGVSASGTTLNMNVN